MTTITCWLELRIALSSVDWILNLCYEADCAKLSSDDNNCLEVIILDDTRTQNIGYENQSWDLCDVLSEPKMLSNKRFAGVLIAVLISVLFCSSILCLLLMTLNTRNPANSNIDKFAIVLDAGSTGTRSTLFQLDVGPNVSTFQNSRNSTSQFSQLNEFIRINPISKCHNGLPLTELNSVQDAGRLLQNCLPNFLNLIHARNASPTDVNNTANSTTLMTTIEQDYANISTSINKTPNDRRRPNGQNTKSLILLYLGATAGMRSLGLLQPDRVDQKFKWLRKSASESSRDSTSDTFYIGPNSIQVLTGPQEAAYSWLSVNYFCNQLSHSKAMLNNTSTFSTLELGGSSAQMAYEIQASDTTSNDNFTRHEYTLKLYNNSIVRSLYARSDPCLGIVQASLRAQILSIRAYLKHQMPVYDIENSTSIEIELECWQSGWQQSISVDGLRKLSKSACLRTSQDDPIDLLLNKNDSRLSMINLRGKLSHAKCNLLIEKLLNPEACKENFALCLGEQVAILGPPQGSPFVTLSVLSNFAHALRLDYNYASDTHSTLGNNLPRDLKLYSIDFNQTQARLRELCETPLDKIQYSFNIKTKYLATACFDYNYMMNLMTNFYGFSVANDKWNQLRFRNKNNVTSAKTSDLCQRGLELDWAAGLMLSQISVMLESKDRHVLMGASSGSTNSTMILCMLITVLSVVIYLSASFLRWLVFYGHTRGSSENGEISID